MTSVNKSGLNSIVRVREHADREGSQFGSPQARLVDYLDHKSPEEIARMQEALLSLLQNPPDRKPGESDAAYIARYEAWNDQVARYEKLLSIL